MLQLPSDQLVTTPFCALGTPVTDFILPPIAGSDGSLIQTQQFGIPPVQEQNPDFGGRPVRRDETNGVLQFYSNVLFFMNQGGQFTFDEDQSTALGGYSEGAVLFDFATKSYVISLIDGNTFDFVTTPSYIDGVKWITLNSLAYPDITDVAGQVGVTGANGLKVYKSATFANDGLGPKISLERTTSHLPNTYNWVFSSEAAIGIIPGQTNGAVMQLQGGVTDPALVASYDGSIRFYSTANPRDLDPTIHTHALAIMGELPVTRIFTVNDSSGNSWQLVCTSTGCNYPVPTNVGLTIHARCTSYTIPGGGSSPTINLSGINQSMLNNTSGVVSVALPITAATTLDQLFVNTNASSNLIVINTSNIGASYSMSLFFSISLL